MVEVDIAEAEVGVRIGEGGGERVDEFRPIRQAGQMIVVGAVSQPRLTRAQLFGDGASGGDFGGADTLLLGQ